GRFFALCGPGGGQCPGSRLFLFFLGFSLQAFAFLFWCDRQPPDALFLDVFEFGDRWYAVLATRLADYTPAMRDRSAKWDTVSVPARAFDRIAVPLHELL
ncbi:MAG: HYExAFE family protein, partial [Planctomycetota bacterium]